MYSRKITDVLNMLSVMALGLLCIQCNFALAAIADCIEDGGQRVCTKPMLSPWKYGYCIANSLSSTLAAANACSAIHP
ncbi:MAG: hypothetical protein ABL878_00275 [Burkholderiales bacterium]